MPTWSIEVLVTIGCGLFLFLVNRLTTKNYAELSQKISHLEDLISQLQKDGWTTEQRVSLEKRLTILESKLEGILDEVIFTKTSHQEFLRLLEKAFIPVAHSPHTPELDELLDKRKEGMELTPKEWQELIKKLEEQAQFYEDLPGKKIALLGLHAIYVARLNQLRRKEVKEH